ncbi:MAG: hypothetical protein JWQ38_2596 [Flavipsychrobacter sp.]|nr:hypothetical protein [Flavipsychrobacter sp.]
MMVYVIAAIFAAVQLYSLGSHEFTFPKDPYPDDIMNHVEKMNQFYGKQLTEYNNYLIFKYSFYHLLDGSNLYGLYPDRHWDYYKYSPTFALLMGPMAVLPNIIGLCIWNILNALVVFLAIRMLPFTTKVQCLLLWFISFEMLTCLQNTQSNGLMCGLMIAAYGSMHNGKAIWATLWLVLATYIKVYGAIGFCLFLFYPGKLKFIGWAILWTIVLGALPLIVTPFHTLIWQYHNWADLMIADATAAVGLSVAGVLSTWFGIMNGKAEVTVVGLVLFLVPLARVNMYKNELWRLLVVASMLIWVIIFNHKAESSTYIIAVAGVAIWYFAMPKTNWRTGLLFFVFLFTCLSTTDIFPPYVKEHLIYPYKIKTFPCIVVWCMVFIDLMRLKAGEGKTSKEILMN